MHNVSFLLLCFLLPHLFPYQILISIQRPLHSTLQTPRLLRIHLHLIPTNLLHRLVRWLPSVELALAASLSIRSLVLHVERCVSAEPLAHVD